MNNSTPENNYYELALRAAGPCPPGSDMNGWFQHVADLSVAMMTNAEKQAQFLANVSTALNGNNKGWGAFLGTITHVEMRPKVANRAFIRYTAWNNKTRQEAEEEIRTMPTTGDSDAMAVYRKAEALVGRRVRLFKRPDPTATGDQIPKVLFHLIDEGEASGRVTAPAEQSTGNGNGNNAAPPPPPSAPRSAQPEPKQEAPKAAEKGDFTAPEPTLQSNQAKRALFGKVYEAGAAERGWGQNQVAAACVVGWAAIGDPGAEAEIKTSDLERAYEAAIGATDDQLKATD